MSSLRSAGWLVAATGGRHPPRSPDAAGLAATIASVTAALADRHHRPSAVYPRPARAGRLTGAARADSRPWLLACGFCAGVLGGAYGMNGPPLVLYGAMRRWSAQHFRATLQAYFLPASILGMAGYWTAGLWTPPVTHYYLLSLPLILLAVVLGRGLNDRLRGDVFLRYVHLGLVVIGATLLVQAIHG